jgi:hypothetical protein
MNSDDVLPLFAGLHRSCLCRLSKASGLPLQGLAHGGRALRDRLSPITLRKLRDIDTTFAFIRHITNEKVGAFLLQLDAELGDDRASPHTQPLIPLPADFDESSDAVDILSDKLAFLETKLACIYESIDTEAHGLDSGIGIGGSALALTEHYSIHDVNEVMTVQLPEDADLSCSGPLACGASEVSALGPAGQLSPFVHFEGSQASTMFTARPMEWAPSPVVGRPMEGGPAPVADYLAAAIAAASARVAAASPFALSTSASAAPGSGLSPSGSSPSHAAWAWEALSHRLLLVRGRCSAVPAPSSSRSIGVGTSRPLRHSTSTQAVAATSDMASSSSSAWAVGAQTSLDKLSLGSGALPSLGPDVCFYLLCELTTLNSPVAIVIPAAAKGRIRKIDSDGDLYCDIPSVVHHSGKFGWVILSKCDVAKLAPLTRGGDG